MYLSGTSLLLENEIVDDTTQTIPLTLITKEASGYQDH